MITVDIAFAPDSQTQLRLTLQLADDSRVIDAVNATGWQPKINLPNVVTAKPSKNQQRQQACYQHRL